MNNDARTKLGKRTRQAREACRLDADGAWGDDDASPSRTRWIVGVVLPKVLSRPSSGPRAVPP
jgi:hypothetical protein